MQTISNDVIAIFSSYQSVNFNFIGQLSVLTGICKLCPYLEIISKLESCLFGTQVQIVQVSFYILNCTTIVLYTKIENERSSASNWTSFALVLLARKKHYFSNTHQENLRMFETKELVDRFPGIFSKAIQSQVINFWSFPSSE